MYLIYLFTIKLFMKEFHNIKYPCGCKINTVNIMYESKEKFLPIEFIICEVHKKEFEEKRWR